MWRGPLMADSRAAFSRSNRSCLLGGRTQDVRTKVPVETEEILRSMARSAGYGALTEYVADVLMIHAHGLDTVAKLQMQRLQGAARKGQE